MILRDPGLPVTREAELLDLCWQTVNLTLRPLPERELALMRRIDELQLKLPFQASRKLADKLQRESHEVGCRRVTTLVRRMGIEALYRWSRARLPARCAAIYPDLLSSFAAERPNQLWVSGITYLPMTHGFMYLAAILDVASRKVRALRLSNILTAGFCVEAPYVALAKLGQPKIFNINQGAQFTSDE